jgi:hypothetical protein
MTKQKTAKEEFKKRFYLGSDGLTEEVFNWHISQLKKLEKEVKKARESYLSEGDTYEAEIMDFVLDLIKKYER